MDKENKLRGAADRAAVLGDYLATEQFGREPNHSYSIPRVLNGHALAPGVNLDYEFTDSELIRTLSQLKNGKSPKPNGIPNELWKVLLVDSELRSVLRKLFNACLEQGRVPELWEAGELLHYIRKITPENLKIIGANYTIRYYV